MLVKLKYYTELFLRISRSLWRWRIKAADKERADKAEKKNKEIIRRLRKIRNGEESPSKAMRDLGISEYSDTSGNISPAKQRPLKNRKSKKTEGKKAKRAAKSSQ